MYFEYVVITFFAQQIEIDKVQHQKAHKTLFKKKDTVNLSKFFLDWSFFHKILQDCGYKE